ncbi:MAG: glycosyltransferase [Bacteroidota bacterium]
MKTLYDIAYFIIEYVIFGFTILLFTTYILLAVISALHIRKYLRKSENTNYDLLLNSEIAPSVSIIAPAYNEGLTIVQNTRSLLSLYYSNFNLIVVNDGSSDNSLALLIEEFDLEPHQYPVFSEIPTKPIRNIYRSRNPSYSKLIVVDKENGGKSDALNVGINLSESMYYLAVDVDSIIQDDAIIKIIKPFLDKSSKKVIAAGGVVRIANSCEVNKGRVVKVHFPKNFWARFQVLEYIRAFLMGRIAWSRLEGLLLVSGAFGMFNREIVVAVGGYSTKTVGEDMELIVRMRRHMVDLKIPYKIVYIPDPLCWTIAPTDIRSLIRQRNRWMRGTIETLFKHRKICLNPKYKSLGMLGYPYWLLFEWMAPIIEIIGIVYFIIIAFLGIPNWPFFFVLLFFVYFFSVTYSLWAFVFEEFSYHRYEKPSDIAKALIAILIEPFLYHPFILFASISANFDKIRRKDSWGRVKRIQFDSQKAEK